MVIPLLSEVLSDTEAQSPQRQAGLRTKSLPAVGPTASRQAFSHLPILLLLDGLYPNGPINPRCAVSTIGDFMIVLQDGFAAHGLGGNRRSAKSWSAHPLGRRSGVIVGKVPVVQPDRI